LAFIEYLALEEGIGDEEGGEGDGDAEIMVDC